MLGIGTVTIKGFQSHVDSCFTLSPGLTVITGPSDAGKTAVIRALRWLTFNEPQGEAFLHTVRNPDGSVRTACDEASVAVEFTDGTVITKTRRKGKTTYTHSLYPEPWEKAEVPPEIKETLGLVKQSYGDTFETCLNFAFQLDPPFLLSETGSAGAKVLGKLAGTEVVDKAIGAVNKLAHRTRTEIAQAEKSIGQLDVELLEYLEVDQNFAVLLQLETLYQSAEEHAGSCKALQEVNNRYTAFVERKQGFLDTLNRFALLDSLVQSFTDTADKHSKLQRLQGMDTTFWTQIKVCEGAQDTLRTLKYVPLLRSRLNTVTDQERRVADLSTLCDRYTAGSNAALSAKAAIIAADAMLVFLCPVGLLEDRLRRVTVLRTVADTHRTTAERRNDLQATVDTLNNLDALRGKLEGVAAIVEKLRTLQGLAYKQRQNEAQLTAGREYLYECGEFVKDCAASLEEVWKAAGGVCPMCQQPLERTNNLCTH